MTVSSFSHAGVLGFEVDATGYAAATGIRKCDKGWNKYCRWNQALWSGRVQEVPAELTRRQEELGLPVAGKPDRSPRQIVADTAIQTLRRRDPYFKYDRRIDAKVRRAGFALPPASNRPAWGKPWDSASRSWFQKTAST